MTILKILFELFLLKTWSLKGNWCIFLGRDVGGSGQEVQGTIGGWFLLNLA